MREIEFRAYCPEKKYMAYQGTPDLETIQSFMYHWGDKLLMQYTGFRDKNGKKIYECDIVEVCNRNNPEDKLVGKIRCSENSEWMVSAIELSSFIRIGDHVEFIGNVFENPEIL